MHEGFILLAPAAASVAAAATLLAQRERLLLARAGEAAFTIVDRSSGHPELDVYAAELASRLRFRPSSGAR